MSDVTPIPKRTRDQSRRAELACRVKILSEGRCRLCGRVPTGSHLDSLNRAHLLRGSEREWDPRGTVPLCGSGTTGCHYLADAHPDAKRYRALLRLVLDPDEIAYCVERIGEARFDALYPRQGVDDGGG